MSSVNPSSSSPASFSPSPSSPMAETLSHFTCRRCGACCRGEGHVYLDDDDIQQLAGFFHLEIIDFLHRYTQILDAGYCALLDQDDVDKSCIFLTKDGCRVHGVKPRQCRDFPFRWRNPNIDQYCEGWREASRQQ